MPLPPLFEIEVVVEGGVGVDGWGDEAEGGEDGAVEEAVNVAGIVRRAQRLSTGHWSGREYE